MKTANIHGEMIKRYKYTKTGKVKTIDYWFVIWINDFDINIDKVRFERYLKEFNMEISEVKFKEDCEVTTFH